MLRLEVLYGHLEGAASRFARDPTGHMAREAGIFQKHGLEVSWQHVQGTEERYRRLTSGVADISFVVGRASLKHFLDTGTTRVIGSSMNRCPYFLITRRGLHGFEDLRGRSVACRESVARISPLAAVFRQRGGLHLGRDVELESTEGDQGAFDLLVRGRVQAALLPRPFGFVAEEEGYRRLEDWPEVVDDPLPITLETTEGRLDTKGEALRAFVGAHAEAINHLKRHRAETENMLRVKFGFSPGFAAMTYEHYLPWLDDRLTVGFSQLERLLEQIAPHKRQDARQIATDWLAPWALRG